MLYLLILLLSMNTYFTLKQEGIAEYRVSDSKFVAVANPLKKAADFKNILKNIKARHPKANHHCFAYRIGVDGNNFRSGDDGEPSGTAGRPILGQMDSKNVTDAMIVVVRYFGGTLLGKPGLINAYKTSAALVLQCTPIVEKSILTPVSIDCNYPELQEVLNILRQGEAEIKNQNLQLFCQIHAGIPIASAGSVIDRLHLIKNVAVTTF